MILSTFRQSYDTCKISDSILNNKVLFFSVYREDWQVLAEAKLLTIREIVDHPANRDDRPESVAEAVRRYFEAENAGGDCEGRELAEVLFDQESVEHRVNHLDELGNNGGDDASLYHVASAMIFTLYKSLPESVDYAV